MESSLPMPIYKFTCMFTVCIGVVTYGNTIFQTLKPTRNHYQNHNQYITNSITVIVIRISTHLTVFIIIHNLNRGNCIIIIKMVILIIIVIIIIILVIIIRNIFIISIVKSLVIPAVWLVLNSVIYSQITLLFALKHICSKSHHWSVLKSHHQFFYSISHHFCFEYKMRCKSLFSAFQQTGNLINKILILNEFW